MADEMDMYPSTEDKPSKPDKDGEDSNEGEETGILPLSMFPDNVKPGYKCEIEVVTVMDQEVEVKKGKHHKEDSKDDDEDKPKKRMHHHHDHEEDFLSDRQMAMMNMGTPGPGMGTG